MWEIYDELIELVPPDVVVDECLVGLHWTLVRAGGATGTAMTVREGAERLDLAGRMRGMPLRRLAERVKSWNWCEAAIGLAGINAAINAPERVEALLGRPLAAQAPENAFRCLQDEIRGRKVAVIGHFPGLEQMARNCQLSILERRPQPGDLPDPACEYVLGEQDYVFITGTTLTNKTLPRLLQLCRRACVVLVGPSTPLTPLLFKHGVDLLAGTVVVDPQPVWTATEEGGVLEIFERGGQMVTMRRVQEKVSDASVR